MWLHAVRATRPRWLFDSLHYKYGLVLKTPASLLVLPFNQNDYCDVWDATDDTKRLHSGKEWYCNYTNALILRTCIFDAASNTRFDSWLLMMIEQRIRLKLTWNFKDRIYRLRRPSSSALARDIGAIKWMQAAHRSFSNLTFLTVPPCEESLDVS